MYIYVCVCVSPVTGRPWRNYFALSAGPRLRDFEDSGLCRESPGLTSHRVAGWVNRPKHEQVLSSDHLLWNVAGPLYTWFSDITCWRHDSNSTKQSWHGLEGRCFAKKKALYWPTVRWSQEPRVCQTSINKLTGWCGWWILVVSDHDFLPKPFLKYYNFI